VCRQTWRVLNRRRSAHSLADQLDWDNLSDRGLPWPDNNVVAIPLPQRRLSSRFIPGGCARGFFGSTLHTLALTRELVGMARGFDGAGISMIVLKGPAFALDAYGDTARRQFVDLDLLIHPADLPRAADILVAEGYSPQAFEPGSRGAEFFLSYEDQFVSNADGGPIDLHWRLLPNYFPFALDEDSIWRTAQRRLLISRKRPGAHC
jgi:hypothetical protein